MVIYFDGFKLMAAHEQKQYALYDSIGWNSSFSHHCQPKSHIEISIQWKMENFTHQTANNMALFLLYVCIAKIQIHNVD